MAAVSWTDSAVMLGNSDFLVIGLLKSVVREVKTTLLELLSVVFFLQLCLQLPSPFQG